MLNALHSFFLKISRPSILVAVTSITFVFFWLIRFHGVPGVPSIDKPLRIGLPDMMFTYAPSTIFVKLTRFGADGRSAYRIFLERVDFLFPAVYGFFFVMTTTLGLARLFPNRPTLQKLSLLPLGASFFDFAENVCFLVLLKSYPRELPNTEKLANAFTLVKWGFAAVSVLLLCVSILGLLVRNLRKLAFAQLGLVI